MKSPRFILVMSIVVGILISLGVIHYYSANMFTLYFCFIITAVCFFFGVVLVEIIHDKPQDRIKW